MSGSMSRRQAIEAVTTYSMETPGFQEPLADTFGRNVFSLSVMKTRRPAASSTLAAGNGRVARGGHARRARDARAAVSPPAKVHILLSAKHLCGSPV